MDTVDLGQHIFDGVVGHEGALAVTRSALREGDVHVMFEGPPACGKSALMLAIEDRIPGAIYRDGKSITAAKLRDRLKEDPSIFIIDEIDALDNRAYDELALPLEHGRVQRDTAKESYDIEIGTQMIAACNDSMELPQNIRSRFRTVELSKYSDDDYLTLCGEMLPDMVEWISTHEEGREIGRIVMETTGETDPRDARDVARLAGNMDEVPGMSQALIDADANVESEPITPAEVKRAQSEIGKDRLAELTMEEERIRAAADQPDESDESAGAAVDEAVEDLREGIDEGETAAMREEIEAEVEAEVEAAMQNAAD